MVEEVPDAGLEPYFSSHLAALERRTPVGCVEARL